ncbi:MAG: hypothetical protein QUS14_07375, partial [Pyrinomonadaceae bacterium]|nr:hypothetical protein [Pyrinomonadaceae bacterium]
MRFIRSSVAGLLALSVIASACGTDPKQPSFGGLPVSLADLPAVRLNFRYEGDVPAPELPPTAAEERNQAVQTDFDTNRPGEILDRTLT